MLLCEKFSTVIQCLRWQNGAYKEEELSELPKLGPKAIALMLY